MKSLIITKIIVKNIKSLIIIDKIDFYYLADNLLYLKATDFSQVMLVLKQYFPSTPPLTPLKGRTANALIAKDACLIQNVGKIKG